MNHYPLELFWSDEDGGYIATVPDLPGCSAYGDTEADAIQEAHAAISAWIEAMQAAGNPVPEPSRPVSELAYSGKFLMRIPKRLHADLARSAKDQGVSLNQYVLYLLTELHTTRRNVA